MTTNKQKDRSADEDLGKNEAEDMDLEEPAPTAPTEDQTEELGGQADKAREYLDHLQRLQAEFDNYRKRMTREQARMAEVAARSLIESLLPVLDNFELALRSLSPVSEPDKLIDGIRLVYADFIDVLHRQGLEKIEAKGADFDPQIHEAVLCEDTEDLVLDNKVIDVMRDGYLLAGMMIRPAMVKVAKYKK